MTRIARWLSPLVTAALLALTLLPLSPSVAVQACVSTTPEWEAMATDQVAILRDNGSSVRFRVKVADDGRERSAGFQHICPNTIKQMPMLFVFPQPTTVLFHMRNVYAPLDIAFVNSDGQIVEIRSMMTEDSVTMPKYYRPSKPISAALEAEFGFFASHGIVEGAARMSLPESRTR